MRFFVKWLLFMGGVIAVRAVTAPGEPVFLNPAESPYVVPAIVVGLVAAVFVIFEIIYRVRMGFWRRR